MIIVELRKQISGYETSLLKCDRKKAVKIRVKVSNLKIMLEDIILDAADARNGYTEEISEGKDSGEVYNKNSDSKDSKDSLESAVNSAEYNSVVDRGTELLAKLLSDGRPVGSIEETWERVILAERMRYNLQVVSGDDNPTVGDTVSIDKEGSSVVSAMSVSANPSITPAQSYVDYINKNYVIAKRVAMVIKS